MNIYPYTDYHLWLKESLDELKKQKPFASIRYVGNRTGIDPGNLVRVLQGKIHLSRKCALSMGQFLNLDKKEQSYLEELIVLAKTKTDQDAWESYNRLHAMKGVEVRKIEDHEFEFFKQWYHVVIRSLLNVVDVKNDYRTLSKMLIPNISVKEIKGSISLLEKLGMVSRNDKGFWKAQEQFVGSGSKWKGKSIQNYQKKNLELAINSLQKIKPEERDISTVTLSIPTKEIPLFKEKIKGFRSEIMGMAQNMKDDDSIYQMNISFFPSGKINPEEKN